MRFLTVGVTVIPEALVEGEAGLQWWPAKEDSPAATTQTIVCSSNDSHGAKLRQRGGHPEAYRFYASRVITVGSYCSPSRSGDVLLQIVLLQTDPHLSAREPQKWF